MWLGHGFFMVAEYSQPQRERSEAYSGGAGKLADRVEQKENGLLEDSLQEEVVASSQEATDQENTDQEDLDNTGHPKDLYRFWEPESPEQ